MILVFVISFFATILFLSCLCNSDTKTEREFKNWERNNGCSSCSKGCTECIEDCYDRH